MVRLLPSSLPLRQAINHHRLPLLPSPPPSPESTAGAGSCPGRLSYRWLLSLLGWILAGEAGGAAGGEVERKDDVFEEQRLRGGVQECCVEEMDLLSLPRQLLRRPTLHQQVKVVARGFIFVCQKKKGVAFLLVWSCCNVGVLL